MLVFAEGNLLSGTPVHTQNRWLALWVSLPAAIPSFPLTWHVWRVPAYQQADEDRLCGYLLPTCLPSLGQQGPQAGWKGSGPRHVSATEDHQKIVEQLLPTMAPSRNRLSNG